MINKNFHIKINKKKININEKVNSDSNTIINYMSTNSK